MGLDSGLSATEDVSSFATYHLPDKLAAVAGSANNLSDRDATLDQGQDRGSGLLAPKIALILKSFSTGEQVWIDRRGTDCRADRPHGFAYGIEECRTCVLHEVPAVGDLNREGRSALAAASP